MTASPCLYADGKFSTKDGKAFFMATPWRGLQAPGKAEQKAKYKFLVNNGRTNAVWQNAFMDQHNDFVMDRIPYPFIEMNPDDMNELSWQLAISSRSMVQPTPSAKRRQTFMLFAYPTGVQGNVVNAGVNELIIPNYKQTWADIRKLPSAPEPNDSHSNHRNTKSDLGKSWFRGGCVGHPRVTYECRPTIGLQSAKHPFRRTLAGNCCNGHAKHDNDGLS